MRKLIVASFLLILVLCSCEILDLIREQPEVEVVFKELTPLGLNFYNNTLDFLAKLDVTNKGSAAIPNTKIDYDLFLMNYLTNDYYDESFISGSVDENTRIEGGETKTLEVPVNIDIEKLWDQGPSILIRYLANQRDVDYKIVMKISFLNIPIIERPEIGTFTLPAGLF